MITVEYRGLKIIVSHEVHQYTDHEYAWWSGYVVHPVSGGAILKHSTNLDPIRFVFQPIRQEIDEIRGGKRRMPFDWPHDLESARLIMGKKFCRPVPSIRSTWLVNFADGVVLKYHDTPVVTWESEGLRLNSGGFRTPTTKERINTALRAAGLKMQVGQKNWAWYIGGGLFVDGMLVTYGGEIRDNDGAEQAAAELESLQKGIRQYARAVRDAILAGSLPAPAENDCYYCKPRYDKAGGVRVGTVASHALIHVREQYIVGHLVENAVREYGTRAALSDIHRMWHTDPCIHTGYYYCSRDRLAEVVEYAVKRYLRHTAVPALAEEQEKNAQ